MFRTLSRWDNLCSIKSWPPWVTLPEESDYKASITIIITTTVAISTPTILFLLMLLHNYIYILMMRWEKADPISIKGTFFNVLRKYLPKAQSSKPESQKPKKKNSKVKSVMQRRWCTIAEKVSINLFQAKLLRKTKMKKEGTFTNICRKAKKPI